MILVLTETGKLARLVSKYKPAIKILAASSSEKTVLQTNTSRGVIGHKVDNLNDVNLVIKKCIEDAKNMKLLKTGNKVAVIHGTNEDTPDESNIMKILDA